MPVPSPSTVWITGASSGIGRALALRLAQDGRVVIASARNVEALAALTAEGSGRIIPWPIDVTDPVKVRSAYAAIELAHGPIGLAVLNAGTHRPVSAHDFTSPAVRELVEVNLMGVTHCLDIALESMRARRSGHIAVVASLAGYGGLPTAAAYGATKAALINMCEALKPECDALGVKLQIVVPGFVRTPLTDRNPFPMPFLISSERAAGDIAAGLNSDCFEIAFPRRFVFLMKLLRMLPYPLYFPLVARITRGS